MRTSPIFKGSGEYIQNVCECGHYQQAHGPHAEAGGHGECRTQGCDCERFTWGEFAEYRKQRPPMENAPRV